MIFPSTKIQNRYRADALLGRGGMGEVWRCFDEKLSRTVVIKIVAPELAKTRPQHTAIFIDEARIGASLVGHPNVVNVFDVLNDQNPTSPLLAIVMEFVEGLSCSQWIDIPLDLVDALTKHFISLQIAIETCKALQYAHRHNILHRDIKPLNVFLSKYGIAKIGDFGIARYADAVTREHTVWNFRSPAYSAPEQWRDGKPSWSTDVYQLGCTLYHLFTGQLPFEASNVAALIQKHLAVAPHDPSTKNKLISEPLATVMTRCLAKNVGDRPALWEVYDALTTEVQHDYSMRISFDKSDNELINTVTAITDFSHASLKADGEFHAKYVDYNEAISEAMQLALLGKVKIELRKID